MYIISEVKATPNNWANEMLILNKIKAVVMTKKQNKKQISFSLFTATVIARVTKNKNWGTNEISSKVNIYYIEIKLLSK